MQWMFVSLILATSTNALSQDDMQFDFHVEVVPHNRLTSELAKVVYTSLSVDNEKINGYERQHIRPIKEKLNQHADNRIPSQATHAQRAKLLAAASLDIKHAISEFRSGFTVPERFPTLAEKLRKDIFGPGSLFEKVMRQQGLLDNRATVF